MQMRDGLTKAQFEGALSMNHISHADLLERLEGYVTEAVYPVLGGGSHCESCWSREGSHLERCPVAFFAAYVMQGRFDPGKFLFKVPLGDEWVVEQRSAYSFAEQP